MKKISEMERLLPALSPALMESGSRQFEALEVPITFSSAVTYQSLSQMVAYRDLIKGQQIIIEGGALERSRFQIERVFHDPINGAIIGYGLQTLEGKNPSPILLFRGTEFSSARLVGADLSKQIEKSFGETLLRM